MGRASDPHLVLPLLACRLPRPEPLRRTLALTAGRVEGATAAESRKPAALAATLQVLLEPFNSQTNQPTNQPTAHHTDWVSLSELCLQHHLSQLLVRLSCPGQVRLHRHLHLLLAHPRQLLQCAISRSHSLHHRGAVYFYQSDNVLFQKLLLIGNIIVKIYFHLTQRLLCCTSNNNKKFYFLSRIRIICLSALEAVPGGHARHGAALISAPPLAPRQVDQVWFFVSKKVYKNPSFHFWKRYFDGSPGEIAGMVCLWRALHLFPAFRAVCVHTRACSLRYLTV